MNQNTPNGGIVQGVVSCPHIVTVFDGAPAVSKTFTVPARETWKINWMQCNMTTSAVGGTARRMSLEIKDALGNVIFNMFAGNGQAASSTYNYHYAQGAVIDASARYNAVGLTIPIDLYLQPGFSIRFYATEGTDPAGDTMTASIQYQKFEGL